MLNAGFENNRLFLNLPDVDFENSHVFLFLPNAVFENSRVFLNLPGVDFENSQVFLISLDADLEASYAPGLKKSSKENREAAECKALWELEKQESLQLRGF